MLILSRAYFQTHFFDAAYHSDTTGKVPNAHPSWAFSDDVTELYFDSSEHMERSFKSQWVREKVGPDGVNFSDFSAVMPMFVKEEKLPIPMLDASEEKSSEENEYVAMYFVSLKDDLIQPEQLASLFAACLQQYASGEVRKLIVNTPTKVDFDLGAYFKGNSVVNFGLVFTVTLQGAQSVESVRKAQKKFESESGGSLDLPNSWIGFGERAVVLDQRTGIKVSTYFSIST